MHRRYALYLHFSCQISLKSTLKPCQVWMKLAICRLGAADAFAASCVSKEWHHALSAEQDHVGMWKQVCRNSFPLATKKLEHDQSMDFRRLAMGLRWSEKPGAARAQPKAPATMRPNQVFAVVDIYRTHQDSNGKRRKEMVSSSICLFKFPEGVELLRLLMRRSPTLPPLPIWMACFPPYVWVKESPSVQR